LELLNELVCAGAAALSECVATLHRLHYGGPNGVKVYLADSLGFEHVPSALRAPDSYVGLINGGATCYMNSVFQQVRVWWGLFFGGEEGGRLYFASFLESIDRSVDPCVVDRSVDRFLVHRSIDIESIGRSMSSRFMYGRSINRSVDRCRVHRCPVDRCGVDRRLIDRSIDPHSSMSLRGIAPSSLSPRRHKPNKPKKPSHSSSCSRAFAR
jgi:hypothetical protein